MSISQLPTPPLYAGTGSTNGSTWTARLPGFYGRYLQVEVVPPITPEGIIEVLLRIRSQLPVTLVNHVGVGILNILRRLHSSVRVKMGSRPSNMKRMLGLASSSVWCQLVLTVDLY